MIDQDLAKSQKQLGGVHAVRVGFHIVILGVALFFQSIQPEFIHFSVLSAVFTMLGITFLFDSIYLIILRQAVRYWAFTAFMFVSESIFITALIYFTGVNQSIFLFMYLVNIILCGFVFQRKGAFILSLLTSIFFSLLVVIGPQVPEQTIYLSIGMNNLAFFAVAALSGILSEQLNFMGTELSAKRRDLRALQNLNELIVQNVATGLMSVDLQGNVTQFNRASLEILDLPSRDIDSRKLDLVFPGLWEKLTALAFTDGKLRSEKMDWLYRNWNGEKLVLEFTISTVRNSDGANTGFILAFQDTTRVRRLEFAMRQSEKLAAVGQLAAGIAHEIRNPLASISGSIQLLEDSFSSSQEEERKLMKIVLKEIDRLNNLITEFLEYVRPERPPEDIVDINILVGEICGFIKLNVNLNQNVRQRLDLKARRKILGHKDKLKQAIMNVVLNAYQAMQDTKEPVLSIETEDRGDLVILIVRDNGIGIDENRVRKVFEPFHTTKTKGTGLGLALTHKIIEGHGGRICVESIVKQGSEFIMEFPATDEKFGLAVKPGTPDDGKRKRSQA